MDVRVSPRRLEVEMGQVGRNGFNSEGPTNASYPTSHSLRGLFVINGPVEHHRQLLVLIIRITCLPVTSI